MNSRSLLKILFFLGLLVLLGAQLGGAYNLDRSPFWATTDVVLYIVGFLLIVFSARNALGKDDAKANRPLRTIVLLSVFSFAAVMRFAYISCVYMGFNGESLMFFWYADEVYRTLILQPYSWYTHTLLSYSMAGMFGIVGKTLFAYRLTLAVISFATIIFVFLWLRESISFRVGLSAAVFLACSSLHLYHSRNGYNHAYILFWQALSFWLMFLTLRTKNYWHALAFGLSIGFGLNTQWGYYYTPFVFALFLAALIILDRSALKGQLRNMTTAILIVFFMFLPFYLQFTNWNTRPFSFNYVNGATSKSKIREDKSLIASYEKQLKKEFPELLLTKPIAFQDYNYPLFDTTLGYLMLIGLAIAFSRAFTSPYAFLILLLFLSLGAQTFAKMTIFYSYPLILPFCALAGLGFDGLWRVFGKWRKPLGALAQICLVVLLIAYCGISYDRFFNKQSSWREYDPRYMSGFMLSPVVNASKADRVFVRSGDWEKIITRIAEIANDEKVMNAGLIDDQRLLFNDEDFGPKGFVEVILESDAGKKILPRFRRLYPDLTLVSHPAPKPHTLKKPLLFSLLIDREDSAAAKEKLIALSDRDVLWIEAEHFDNDGYNANGPKGWHEIKDSSRKGYFGLSYLRGARDGEGSSFTVTLPGPVECNVWVRYWPGTMDARLRINEFSGKFGGQSEKRAWLWLKLGVAQLKTGRNELRFVKDEIRDEYDIHVDAVVLTKMDDLDPSELILSTDGRFYLYDEMTKPNEKTDSQP